MTANHPAGAGHDTDGAAVPPADARLDRLADEMHQLRQGILEMRDTILDRIDGAYVRKDTHEIEMGVVKKEIAELKTGRNWTVGIVVGSVIASVLSTVLQHT